MILNPSTKRTQSLSSSTSLDGHKRGRSWVPLDLECFHRLVMKVCENSPNVKDMIKSLKLATSPEMLSTFLCHKNGVIWMGPADPKCLEFRTKTCLENARTPKDLHSCIIKAMIRCTIK